MSTSQTRLSYPDFERLAPKTVAALYGLGAAPHGSLDAPLIELLELRASQINGCAYCVQYHLDLAHKAGLPQAKIDMLPVWREAGMYAPRELAALAWTEHLTDIRRQGAPDAAWAALREVFSEAEAAHLCVAIVAINAWNRIAIALGFAPTVA
ncbi:MAG: carboxymuconolactone decarboxylase family protein [Rhodoferax sp.]|uniref:carboxymuconolactone decarboxylase family protein n=1 Tax=Rhodoferax sp. TaxID=50421 RepID=UPI003264A378